MILIKITVLHLILLIFLASAPIVVSRGQRSIGNFTKKDAIVLMDDKIYNVQESFSTIQTTIPNYAIILKNYLSSLEFLEDMEIIIKLLM